MKVPLHLRVKNTIMQRIRDGEYQPGQRLPTQEQFAREFSVAFGTVAKAIKELRAEGVIDARPHAGMHVREPADRHGGTLAFMVREVAASAVFQRMFFDICKRLRDFNFESTIIPALQHREQGLVDFLPARRLAGRPLAGVISMNIMDITYLAQLKELTPLVIVLDRDTREVGLDCVIFDNIGASFSMTSRLLADGHQAVGLLCLRPPTGRERQRDYDPASNERFHGYRLALEAAGVSLRPEWVQHSDGYDASCWEAAARRLLATAPECTALLTESGVKDMDKGVWTALAGCGRELAVAGWESWAKGDEHYLQRLALHTTFDLNLMAGEVAALFRRRVGRLGAEPEQVILRGVYSWE